MNYTIDRTTTFRDPNSFGDVVVVRKIADYMYREVIPEGTEPDYDAIRNKVELRKWPEEYQHEEFMSRLNELAAEKNCRITKSECYLDFETAEHIFRCLIEKIDGYEPVVVSVPFIARDIYGVMTDRTIKDFTSVVNYLKVEQ